ncbi:MAG: hypothetical protein ABL982_16265 [Vicinamibacterales bacterium]
MTQPFDEQLTRAFDSLSERLHAQIADQLLDTGRQITAAAESDRQAAADAAARDAATLAEQQVTERLQQEYAGREAQVKDAARAEGFEAGQQLLRAEALAIQSERDAVAQAAADAAAVELGEHRAQLAELRAMSARTADEQAHALAALRREHEAVVTSLRAEYDTELADARAELEAARVHVQAAHADAQAALAAAAARVGAAIPVHPGTGGASHTRLQHAVRALDTASSLSQTLDALFAAARAEARRVVVFLVRGDALRTWNHAGFDGLPSGSTIDLPLADAGLVADAIRAAGSSRLGADSAARPAFAATSSAGPLVAVPLSMNGQVIAVLCAEEDAGSSDSLTSTFEVFARHAARVLESLTALRLAQLAPPPAAGSSQPR